MLNHKCKSYVVIPKCCLKRSHGKIFFPQCFAYVESLIVLILCFLFFCPAFHSVSKISGSCALRSKLAKGVGWIGGLGLTYIIHCAVLSCSVVSDSAAPWTVARQASLSMGILQTRILDGLPCPPLGDLPNPGIEPRSSTL